MSEKIAVHCKTEEEWDAVNAKAHNSAPIMSWSTAKGYEAICIYTNRPNSVDMKVHCIRGGYTIISASEYLKEGEEEFKVGDRVECVDDGSSGSLNIMEGLIYTISKYWEDGSGLGWVRVLGIDHNLLARRFKLAPKPNKQNKKENKNMNERNVNIGSIFLEVFSDGKEAKKMSDRFGDQYGMCNDRDLIALENDKTKLQAIIKKEEAEAAKTNKGA